MGTQAGSYGKTASKAPMLSFTAGGLAGETAMSGLQALGQDYDLVGKRSTKTHY